MAAPLASSQKDRFVWTLTAGQVRRPGFVRWMITERQKAINDCLTSEAKWNILRWGNMSAVKGDMMAIKEQNWRIFGYSWSAFEDPFLRMIVHRRAMKRYRAPEKDADNLLMTLWGSGRPIRVSNLWCACADDENFWRPALGTDGAVNWQKVFFEDPTSSECSATAAAPRRFRPSLVQRWRTWSFPTDVASWRSFDQLLPHSRNAENSSSADASSQRLAALELLDYVLNNVENLPHIPVPNPRRRVARETQPTPTLQWKRQQNENSSSCFPDLATLVSSVFYALGSEYVMAHSSLALEKHALLSRQLPRSKELNNPLRHVFFRVAEHYRAIERAVLVQRLRKSRVLSRRLNYDVLRIIVSFLHRGQGPEWFFRDRFRIPESVLPKFVSEDYRFQQHLEGEEEEQGAAGETN